ncbi:MAG TPA: hypothetical protein VG895_01470 [Patescibacteria group bacterium]|nr:hypothetical protein [Patescibacteria group bacterium]
MEFDNNLDFGEIFQRAKQRHHDYFLRAFYEGKLSKEDEAELKLAIDREHNSIVQPLGAGIPFEDELHNN